MSTLNVQVVPITTVAKVTSADQVGRGGLGAHVWRVSTPFRNSVSTCLVAWTFVQSILAARPVVIHLSCPIARYHRVLVWLGRGVVAIWDGVEQIWTLIALSALFTDRWYAEQEFKKCLSRAEWPWLTRISVSYSCMTDHHRTRCDGSILEASHFLSDSV